MKRKLNKIKEGKLIIFLFIFSLLILLVIFLKSYVVTSFSPRFWDQIFYQNKSCGTNSTLIDNTKCLYKLNSNKEIFYFGNNVLLFPTKIKLNSYGFRDFDYKLEKNKKRILILGDSIVMGLGVPVDYTFPKVLEKNINDKIYDVEVFNGGLPASSLFRQFLFYNDTFSKFKPDIVIFIGSEDDIDCIDFYNMFYFENKNSWLYEYDGIKKEWEEFYYSQLKKKEKDQKKIISEWNKKRLEISKKFETELIELCIENPLIMIKHNMKKENITLLYIDISGKDTFGHLSKSEIFDSFQITFYEDNNKTKSFNNEVFYKNRDDHFTKRGHKIIADWIYKILLKEGLL